jgi:hypothetical protein
MNKITDYKELSLFKARSDMNRVITNEKKIQFELDK